MPKSGILVHYRPPNGVWVHNKPPERTLPPEGSEVYYTVVGPDGVDYPPFFLSLSLARAYAAGLEQLWSLGEGEEVEANLAELQAIQTQALDLLRMEWERVIQTLRGQWGVEPAEGNNQRGVLP